MRTLAIDPGVSGGLAWTDEDGIVQAEPMPEGMTAICDRLRELRAEGIGAAVVERVGTYMPGNAGPAAATFARHCGHLDATLYCLGYSAPQGPTPAQWQKIVPGLPKGTGAEKADRKRAIKEAMARRYPHLRVTLKTADALGILTWANNNRGGQ